MRRAAGPRSLPDEGLNNCTKGTHRAMLAIPNLLAREIQTIRHFLDGQLFDHPHVKDAVIELRCLPFEPGERLGNEFSIIQTIEVVARAKWPVQLIDTPTENCIPFPVGSDLARNLRSHNPGQPSGECSRGVRSDQHGKAADDFHPDLLGTIFHFVP